MKDLLVFLAIILPFFLFGVLISILNGGAPGSAIPPAIIGYRTSLILFIVTLVIIAMSFFAGGVKDNVGFFTAANIVSFILTIKYGTNLLPLNSYPVSPLFYLIIINTFHSSLCIVLYKVLTVSPREKGEHVILLKYPIKPIKWTLLYTTFIILPLTTISYIILTKGEIDEVVPGLKEMILNPHFREGMVAILIVFFIGFNRYLHIYWWVLVVGPIMSVFLTINTLSLYLNSIDIQSISAEVVIYGTLALTGILSTSVQELLTISALEARG